MQNTAPAFAAGTLAWVAAAVVLLLVGLLVGWLLARRTSALQAQAAADRVKAEAGSEVATLTERVRGLETERQGAALELQEYRGQAQALQGDVSGLERRAAGLDASLKSELSAAESLRQQLALQTQSRDTLQREASDLRTQVAELTTQLNAERSQAQEKLALLLGAKEELSNQFKTLASDILEEKGRKFAEQNQNSLGLMLDPLKLRLQEFQGQVAKFYDTEGKERSALGQQVVQLMELNRTLADEAKSLTSALKGSSKTQGNWGELILERVLESCGLKKGVEYETQASVNREDGGRAQADVVIRLPEDRSLVVDAKVSLVAYEEFASSDDDAVRLAARKRHLDSIRSHVKGLSERNYQLLYGLKSLDCVLLFVPIEPAFMVAVTEDNGLFMEAWNKNVLLVSPSTLLIVLRTIAHLWRQEAQSRNAQEIAKRGAELYDRLTAFVTDLERVGKNINQASEAYADAFNKLTRNKGNVIRQAEMLKQLGVKPTKALPGPLVASSGIEGDGDDSDT